MRLQERIVIERDSKSKGRREAGVKTIVGIAGSLRRGSYNMQLLRAAAELMPYEVSLDIASIADVPLYDADIEHERGLPPAVVALKNRITESDGLLLATPEYNHSLPGVLKNAIDWVSRPPRDIPRVFGGKPVALMGASNGRGGTRLAQDAWLPVLRTLGTAPWFGQTLYVSKASEVFDVRGRIVDEKVLEGLKKLVSGFAAFVESPRQGHINHHDVA